MISLYVTRTNQYLLRREIITQYYPGKKKITPVQKLTNDQIQKEDKKGRLIDCLV